MEAASAIGDLKSVRIFFEGLLMSEEKETYSHGDKDSRHYLRGFFQTPPALVRQLRQISSLFNTFGIFHMSTKRSLTKNIQLPRLSLESRTFPGSVRVLESSLCKAAQLSHSHVLAFLLEQGVPITDRVMDSVKAGQSITVYQTLFDHGWDINSKTGSGMTSLCANLANEDIVRWHLEHGADPNIQNSRGHTPIECAACQHSLNVVKLLVQHGADLRYTPALHAAAIDSSKYVSGAHPGRIEIMAFLLDSGADINMLEPWTKIFGRLPATLFTGRALHRAVEGQDPEHVRFLLKRGADPSLKGANGLTPLEIAERYRDLPDYNSHEIVNILRNE